jgi:hypothetical protein
MSSLCLYRERAAVVRDTNKHMGMVDQLTQENQALRLELKARPSLQVLLLTFDWLALPIPLTMHCVV